VSRIRALAPRACVILAGSAGTGEATPAADGSSHSDLEVAVVGWTDALRAARRTRRDHPEVEAYFVAPWRMRLGMERNLGVPRPNLPAFDLARQQQAGELPRVARPARVWMPDQLTRREAIALLNNRIGEWAELGTHYSRIKVAVACGDATLIARKQFVPGYRGRSEVFATIAHELAPELAEAGTAGYRSKLSGDLEPMPAGQLAAAVAALLRAPLAVGTDHTWQGLYAEYSAAWREDAQQAGWGIVARAADRLGTALRARSALPVGRVKQVMRTWRYPTAAVYAGLTSMLVNGSRGADHERRPLPGDVPGALASDVDELLQLWRAFAK
jgi:hypothetical protein